MAKKSITRHNEKMRSPGLSVIKTKCFRHGMHRRYFTGPLNDVELDNIAMSAFCFSRNRRKKKESEKIFISPKKVCYN